MLGDDPVDLLAGKVGNTLLRCALGIGVGIQVTQDDDILI